MPNFEDDLFDIGLDAMAAAIVQVSLHETQPVAGSAEVSGGNYTRQIPQWSPAEGGTVGIDANLEFEVPGGTTIAYVGLWGVDEEWYGSIPLDNTEQFGADGQFTVTALTITASNQSSS